MTTEAAIREFIVGKLLTDSERKPPGDDDSLFSAGVLDSLAFLQLIAFIEEQFGISVEDDEVVPENFETINHIRAFVEGKQQSQ